MEAQNENAGTILAEGNLVKVDWEATLTCLKGNDILDGAVWTLGSEDEPEYLNPRQLALMLNCSLKSVVNWTQVRRVPGQRKIGRLWRYNRIEVEKALLRGQFLISSK